MKQGRVSQTAFAGASVRALESLRSSESRLINDVYAAKFLPVPHRILLGICRYVPGARRIMEWGMSAIYPGVPADFICRTQYIDAAMANASFERLVIIGAGLDGRAIRYAACNTNIELVEIDHPQTQKYKIEKLQKCFPGLVGKINFIAHDLSMGMPPDLNHREKKSFFIIEGLFGYLPYTTVSSLFDYVADNGGAGSQLAFTYVDVDFVQGLWKSKAGKRMANYLDRVGEPFLSGLNPHCLAYYCQQHGLSLVDTLSSEDCARMFLEPLGRDRLPGADFFHLGLAKK